MEFKHSRQHSPATLSELRLVLAADAWSMRQALFLADELVSHACKVDDLAGHRVHEIIGVRGALHRVFCH